MDRLVRRHFALDPVEQADELLMALHVLPDHCSVQHTVANYTRDLAIFRDWARRNAPEMVIAGLGAVGEAELGNVPVADLAHILLTEELMKQNPNTVDAVSQHFYGGVSQRCANRGGWRGPRVARRQEALDPEWLDQTGASLVDSFRYVNQLGLLAQKGVKVVFHNTLGASDYSLIEAG